jgi:hypothetical protein
MQHPPPRDAGHENHPVEHVRSDVDDVVGLGVEDVEGEVGTTTTAVEDSVEEDDEGVGVDEVDGWM